LADPSTIDETKAPQSLPQQLNFQFQNDNAVEVENLDNTSEDITSDIDISRILASSETLMIENKEEVYSEIVSEIEQTAIQQNVVFENTVSEMEKTNAVVLPNEIQKLVKTYRIKDFFEDQAQGVILPQFYLKVPKNELFETEELHLEKENLLKGFALSKADTNIIFDNIISELYKVDLDVTKNEHTPTFVRIDGDVKDSIISYILDPLRKDSRVKNLTSRIMNIIGNMYPIPDNEIEKYIKRILEDFKDEQFSDLANNEYTYTDKIKAKIKSLSEVFAEKKFKEFLDTDKVLIKKSFALPKTISPGETSKDITKSLYEKEGSMNGFEERVINEIGNMTNILFWTRNIERKGFRINGFINHYPDFIIQTKSGKTIVLETKGDHLDAESKIRLGGLWANKAGNDYRYFMVYERRTVDGAYKLEDFLSMIREI
jgi:type III restriction enzyme